jgi:hypothetical protein
MINNRSLIDEHHKILYGSNDRCLNTGGINPMQTALPKMKLKIGSSLHLIAALPKNCSKN